MVRRTLGLPVMSDGLRWLIRQEAVPSQVRTLAHRKLAKAALFGARTFKHRTEGGAVIELAHLGSANSLYWLGSYEPETMAVFARLARTASVIFDVGAGDGLFAILGALANPAARIVAFEPFEGAAAARNLELNMAACQNVELRRLALGAEDGFATLYVASESGGNSSLNPAFRKLHTEQRTEVRRGDSFMATGGIERVDLLKIDTESTEPDVLRGFGGVLARCRPDIVCEVLPGRSEADLMEILGPLGYRYWMLTDEGPQRRDVIMGHPRWVNYLFTTRPSP